MTALFVLFLAQAAATEKAALEGTVVDALTGQPVKGAFVQVRAIPFRAGWPETSTAVTDAAGKFRIENLLPGRVGVSARHDRYPPIMEHPPKTEDAFTLAAGENKDYRYKLQPGAIVSGRVVDEDGEPMPHAYVEAVVEGGDPERARPLGQSSTNDRGEFRIGNLPAGRYRLRARSPRQPLRNRPFAPREADANAVSLTYPLAYHPPSAPGAKAPAFEVQPGSESTGIEIRLVAEKAVPVSGQLTNYRPPVTPGPGLWLSLRRKDAPNTESYSAMAQPDGKFRFPGVRPGMYDLVAMSQQTAELTHFGTRELEVGDQPLKDVAMEAKPAFDVTGVLGAPESPVSMSRAGAVPRTISLNPIDGPPGIRWVQSPVAADGGFAFKGLVGGVLYQVSGPFAYVARMRFNGREVESQTIRFDGPGELSITPGMLPAFANLSISGGEPETGLTVVLQPLDEREKLPRHWIFMNHGQPGVRNLSAPPGRYRVLGVEGSLYPHNVDPDVMLELAKRAKEVDFQPSASNPPIALTPLTRAQLEEIEKRLRQ